MTEEEWLTDDIAGALLWDVIALRKQAAGSPTEIRWRHLAVKVACVERLRSDLPPRAMEWLTNAMKWLGKRYRGRRGNPPRLRLDLQQLLRAHPVADDGLRQRIAAAHDILEDRDLLDRLEPRDMIIQRTVAPRDNPFSIHDPVYAVESQAQCDIIRDVFGNPFRPVTFDPAGRTEHAVGIASKMYDDREFAAMPILADALEEAGCDRADILTHCREPGVHVRGCWVVDLVLGK